nr:unnamed protein product [Digitaria exilis]
MAAITEEHVVLQMKPTAAGSSSGDDPWRARTMPSRRSVLFATIAVASLIISFFEVQDIIDDKNEARFTVDLAAVEGLNATTIASGGRTVSPAFRLAVRVENPRVLTAWCSSRGGRAVVSYGGVSLAWGPVPGFCAARNGGAAEVVVAAAGRGVGLSEGLRRSLVEELDAGTARVVVEMWLAYDGNGWSSVPVANDGVALVWRELSLPGQGHGAL